MTDSILSTTPGALIGYTHHGRPVYLQAGGADTGEEADEGAGDGGGEQSGNSGAGGNAGGGGDSNANASSTSGGQQGGQSGGTGQQASQQNGQGPQQPSDVSELPDWAQKLIRDTRDEAANNRKKAKEAQDQHTNALDSIAKALGLKDDDNPPDPKKLADDLTNERSKSRQALVELAVYKGANKHGAAPEALTDSRSFLNKIDDLDPTADNFGIQLDNVIKQMVDDHPKFKAAGQAPEPPPRSGGEFHGGQGETPPASGKQSIDELRKTRQQRRSGEP